MKRTYTRILFSLIAVALSIGVLYLVTVSQSKTSDTLDGGISSIRDIDFNELLTKEYAEFCSEGGMQESAPIDTALTQVAYADLTNGGYDEAVVTASSCVVGNGGADILRVYSLLSPGHFIQLRFDEGLEFNGTDYAATGNFGNARLFIQKNTLFRSLQREDGAELTFEYRWNGTEFVISNAVFKNILDILGTEKDGKYFGFIKEMKDLDTRTYLVIDFAEWQTDCSGNDCPNGFRIVNENTRLRSFPVTESARVEVQTYSHSEEGFSFEQIIPFATFKKLIQNPPSEYPATEVPFWVVLQDGVIISITERYTP